MLKKVLFTSLVASVAFASSVFAGQEADKIEPFVKVSACKEACMKTKADDFTKCESLKGTDVVTECKKNASVAYESSLLKCN